MTPWWSAARDPDALANGMRGGLSSHRARRAASRNRLAEFGVGAADGRERDLLPLPLGTFQRVFEDRAVGRVARRRRGCLLHADRWAEDAVRSLNEMALGPEAKRKANLKPSVAQVEFLDKLRCAVADLGRPPEDLDGHEALGALLSRQGYAGESAALAPLDVNILG